MKKSFIVILFAMLFLQGTYNVDASGICSQSIYNNLKREAYNVSFGWELKFDEKHNSYFEVTVSNMNKNILLIFAGETYEVTDSKPFILKTPLEGGKKYEFKFYGGYDNPCVEEYVYTKYLELPKYNKYSELEECIEYEEFALCNKWYEGEIKNETYFKEKLEEYKKSLEKPEEKPPVEKEKNIFEKIIDFYLDNIMFTLPITVIFVVVIAVFVVIKIRKSRNRP